MSRLAHRSALVLAAFLWQALLPGSATAQAQRRGTHPRTPPPAAVPRGPERPHPVHVAPSIGLRGQIFIGGYFYDPFYGPYPWWNRVNYPYWYRPMFDLQADLRIQVTPKELRDAAVYVDGFYAGTVDQFDGVFQSLKLESGPYLIEIVAPGYEPLEVNVRISPGEKVTYRGDLRREP